MILEPDQVLENPTYIFNITKADGSSCSLYYIFDNLITSQSIHTIYFNNYFKLNVSSEKHIFDHTALEQDTIYLFSNKDTIITINGGEKNDGKNGTFNTFLSEDIIYNCLDEILLEPLVITNKSNKNLSISLFYPDFHINKDIFGYMIIDDENYFIPELKNTINIGSHVNTFTLRRLSKHKDIALKLTITSKKRTIDDQAIRGKDRNKYPIGYYYTKIKILTKDELSGKGIKKLKKDLRILLEKYLEEKDDIIGYYTSYTKFKEQEKVVKDKKNKLKSKHMKRLGHKNSCQQTRKPHELLDYEFEEGEQGDCDDEEILDTETGECRRRGIIYKWGDGTEHNTDQYIIWPRYVEDPDVYVCDSRNINKQGNMSDYIGIQKNNNPKSQDIQIDGEYIYKYLPCCFRDDQTTRPIYKEYYGNLESKLPATNIPLNNKNILKEGQYGFLPKSYDTILNTHYPNYFFRRGVRRTPNSFIECLLEIFDENFQELLQDIEHANDQRIDMYVNNKRESYALQALLLTNIDDVDDIEYIMNEEQGIHLNITRQENYDLHSISKYILDIDKYFDPKRFIRLLEKDFECNIFIIQSTVKDGIGDYVVQVPYHKQLYYYTELKYDRTVIIHEWGENVIHSYPQCEYVFHQYVDNSNTLENLNYLDLEKSVDNKINKILWNQFIGQCNGYNGSIQNRPRPLIDEENIVSQIFDSYGKAHKFLYKNDNKPELDIFPYPPLPIEETLDIRSIQYINKRKLALYYSRYIIWLFSRYIYDNNIEIINDAIINNFIEESVIIEDNFMINISSNDEKFSMDNDIFNDDGLLIIPNNNVLQRLIYVLQYSLSTSLDNLINYYKYTYIPRYYIDIHDFRKSRSFNILVGSEMYKEWDNNTYKLNVRKGDIIFQKDDKQLIFIKKLFEDIDTRNNYLTNNINSKLIIDSNTSLSCTL
jgi:hypothetical protein